MASPDELWLVDFGPPHPAEAAWRRPALVLGPPDVFGPAFPNVIVAPLTSRHRGLSVHVEVEASPATGLDEVSYVQCEQLRSVSKDRLVHRLGAAPDDVAAAVDTVVRHLLGH